MKTLILVLLFSLLFLTGLGSTGIIDYDEACYAEISREMMRDDNLLVPTLNGKPFFEKPPLLFWIQVLGYKLFGISPLGARIGNALAAILTVLSLFLIARRPMGDKAAFLAALILGGNLLFVGLARIALTDMLLCLCLLLCMGFFHRAIESFERSAGSGMLWFLTACLMAGIAMLAKGAIGAVLPGIAAFVYLLTIRKLRIVFRPAWFIPGIVVGCSIGFSWYLMLGFTLPDGFAFMSDLFLKHHVGRFTSPMQGHSGPIIFYIPILLIGFLPWSPLIPYAMSRPALRSAHDEKSRQLRLFGIFSLVTFVFFSIAATKLPGYIMPALPGFSLIVASLLGCKDKDRQIESRGLRLSVIIAAILLLCVAGIFAAIPWVTSHLEYLLGEEVLRQPKLRQPFSLGIGPYLCAAFLFSGAFAALSALRKKQLPVIIWSFIISSFSLCLVASQLIMPAYNDHFIEPLKRLSLEGKDLTTEDEKLVLIGLRHRPSVIFYSDRYTEYVSHKKIGPLKRLFSGSTPRIGITTELYLARVQENIPLDVLKRDTGYVLFRHGEDNKPTCQQ